MAKRVKDGKKNKLKYALLIGGIMILSTIAYAVFMAASNVEKVKRHQEMPNITYAGNWKGMDVYMEMLKSGIPIYYYMKGNQLVMRTRGNPFLIDKINSTVDPKFIRNLLFTKKHLNIFIDEKHYELLRLPMGELGIFLANKPFSVKSFVVGENRTANPWEGGNETINLYFTYANMPRIYLNGSTIVFNFNSTKYALAEVDYFGFSLLGLIG